MEVALFIPCFIDQFSPETAFNTIKLLEKCGCRVNYDPAQTCCGQPSYNAGFWDEAKAIGGKFLRDFPDDKYIVTPSASCTGMVKNGYNDLFTNTIVHNRCRNIQKNIYELSDFLVNVLKKDYFGAELEGKAVYHDSCSALRECRIREEPRRLLKNVGGLELLELTAEACCGFGGTFSTKFGAISSAMAEQKVMDALDKNADYIISTDSSCLMQLESYINKHQLTVKPLHLADVLTNNWPNI